MIDVRTPAGNVPHCHTCGDNHCVERASGDGVYLCSSCADTLRWFRETIARNRGIRGELVTLASSLADDLVPDSFAMIEMVVAIENEFRVPIAFDEALELETVGDAIRHIETHCRDGRPLPRSADA